MHFLLDVLFLCSLNFAIKLLCIIRDIILLCVALCARQTAIFCLCSVVFVSLVQLIYELSTKYLIFLHGFLAFIILFVNFAFVFLLILLLLLLSHSYSSQLFNYVRYNYLRGKNSLMHARTFSQILFFLSFFVDSLGHCTHPTSTRIGMPHS